MVHLQFVSFSSQCCEEFKLNSPMTLIWMFNKIVCVARAVYDVGMSVSKGVLELHIQMLPFFFFNYSNILTLKKIS